MSNCKNEAKVFFSLERRLELLDGGRVQRERLHAQQRHEGRRTDGSLPKRCSQLESSGTALQGEAILGVDKSQLLRLFKCNV